MMVGMCRNITILRGLQPPATTDEIEAAARQYVRKVSGATRPPAGADEIFERAVAAVADATAALLGELPARRQPPVTVPPSRRYRAEKPSEGNRE
ncbi:MAG: hypothetical protein QOD72_1285 [Acidimicrobiaceae bacterium]|jgi:hypothetical protein|nr:hypothetical protein [Acidimicrobiaceae bacterium]